ncbi:AraC family transcriptional regulator [Variovorax sp. J31P207]|uniref:helix-turn-helix domain-containing protein n=1 Tax=Variovorax sp. J31P207 TaxID=3053510 RepID=UPI002577188C|nr:AraC family transcriptional regulator [Variovorax sp. J31P207]MDM0069968.1 AraC family transcriptional regulator ligand-binding domain-containing protein [Variovorax sp. J31P207]
MTTKGELVVPFAHPIYARCVLDFLNSRGIPSSMVLASAGLGWQDLCDGRRADFSVFCRFVAQAVHFSGESALGLLAGSMFQPYHSPMGIGAVTSKNLGQSLQFVCRHAKLIFGSIDFRMHIGVQWSIVEVKPMRPLYEIHIFVIQFIVGAYCRLLEAIMGRSVEELVVGLPYSRPSGSDVPCNRYVRRVEFGQEHLTFQLPVGLLDEPCASGNASEFFSASQACLRMESELGHGDFEKRVRRALFEQLTTDPGTSDMASELGVSARTLVNRLAEVGLTYSEIKDEVRMTQADWYLRHTEMPIEAIASQLGYAKPANFSRAFKRWHEITPRTMRQNVRVGVPAG